MNDRFLLSSVRCFAARVIAKFDNAGFGNSSKLTCPCQCRICEYWIFDALPPMCIAAQALGQHGAQCIGCHCIGCPCGGMSLEGMGAIAAQMQCCPMPCHAAPCHPNAMLPHAFPMACHPNAMPPYAATTQCRPMQPQCNCRPMPSQ